MRANLRTGAFVLLLAAAAVKAEVVATGLEYHWQPDSKWVRAPLADMRLDPVYNWVHSSPTAPSSAIRERPTNGRPGGSSRRKRAAAKF